jgi:hypothetical protein
MNRAHAPHNASITGTAMHHMISHPTRKRVSRAAAYRVRLRHDRHAARVIAGQPAESKARLAAFVPWLVRVQNSGCVPRQIIIGNSKNDDRVLLQYSCAGTPIGNVLDGHSVLLYLGVVRWRSGSPFPVT